MVKSKGQNKKCKLFSLFVTSISQFLSGNSTKFTCRPLERIPQLVCAAPGMSPGVAPGSSLLSAGLASHCGHSQGCTSALHTLPSLVSSQPAVGLLHERFYYFPSKHLVREGSSSPASSSQPFPGSFQNPIMCIPYPRYHTPALKRTRQVSTWFPTGHCAEAL